MEAEGEELVMRELNPNLGKKLGTLEGVFDVFRQNLPITLFCRIGIGGFLIGFRSKGVD